jgi:hypothetical protein
MAGLYRAAGCTIGPASPVKLKVLELLPKAPALGSWGNGWVLYSESDFDARMATAAAMGANCVKVSCNGLTTSGYPGPVVMERNIQSYCNLLRKYGLKHYMSLVGPQEIVGYDGTLFNTNVPIIQSNVALWMKHGADLMVGGDICNEIQFGGVRPWGAEGSLTYTVRQANDLTAFLAAIRAVAPAVPWSFSVYHPNSSAMTCDLMKLQGMLGCDFHDYHPYNGTNGGSMALGDSRIPKSSDCAALEAAPWFRGRHLIGECGVLSTNSDQATLAYITGLAAQASRPLSAGGVLFGDVDYTDAANNPQPYGITGHPAQIQAFTSWPNATL